MFSLAFYQDSDYAEVAVCENCFLYGLLNFTSVFAGHHDSTVLSLPWVPRAAVHPLLAECSLRGIWSYKHVLVFFWKSDSHSLMLPKSCYLAHLNLEKSRLLLCCPLNFLVSFSCMCHSHQISADLTLALSWLKFSTGSHLWRKALPAWVVLLVS